MILHTKLTPSNPYPGLNFADHKAHEGNALRYVSPRSEYNAAFVNCAIHDALMAHVMLPLLNEVLSHEAKSFDKDSEINAADFLEWFTEWRASAIEIMRGAK